jgi:hypothetical protein
MSVSLFYLCREVNPSLTPGHDSLGLQDSDGRDEKPFINDMKPKMEDDHNHNNQGGYSDFGVTATSVTNNAVNLAAPGQQNTTANNLSGMGRGDPGNMLPEYQRSL